MIIYSDQNNIYSLPVYIGVSISEIAVDIRETKRNTNIVPYLRKGQLPVLEISQNEYVFSVNAAIRYLLKQANKDFDDLQIDSWLEWQATKLQPCVIAYLIQAIGHGKNDSSLETKVKSCLKYLEKSLKGTCLVKDTLSAADIVVWSSVYPLFCEKSPFKGAASEFPKVAAWFSSLHGQKSFQDAALRVTGEEGLKSCKEFLLAQPVPVLNDGIIPIASSKPSNKSNKSDSKTSSSATQQQDVPALPTVTAEEIENAEKAWLDEKLLKSPIQVKHPKKPMKGQRNILITSALPYVNNVPHLGNIIGCVLSGDVFSRYCRMRNYNTLYISGTDEYGTATETKAVEEGLTPQQICDKYNKIHTEIYDWFNCDFDHFGRTTTEWQTKIAQDIFWKLHGKGYILKDEIQQLKCEKCDRYLADRFVEGICPFCSYEDARGDQCDKCGKLINAVELREPRCKVCNEKPITKSTEHLFLDLPKLEPELSDYLEKSWSEGLWTANAKLITKSWIRDGLKPRCITRDLKWGTQCPLQGFTDKVFYVWFDAPIGYLSITANYMGEEWIEWWKNPENVELFQFMAKDNVPFHSVIFPSSQIGTRDGYTVVNHLCATEYLNYEDGKFSKSRGVGVFGSHAKDTGIPADIWRFYLLYVRPESQDSAFSWDDFLLKNNSELLNNLGNFINRSLMFVDNNFKGVIPEIVLTQEDKELLAAINRELNSFITNMEQVRLRDGIRNMLTISRYGNQYIQANKPWVLMKGSDTDKCRAGTVIGVGANITCLLMTLVQPYMPAISKTIQTQLNAPNSLIPDQFTCLLKKGHKIGKPSPLFQKISPEFIAELKLKYAGSAPATSTASSTVIDQSLVTKLTEQVAAQGDVVRKLKADKVDKGQITAAVAILLDLKSKLTAAQGSGAASAGTDGKKKKGNQSKKSAPETQSGKTKPANENSPPNSTPASANGLPVDQAVVDDLTKQVAAQGDLVRQLKTEKAEKSSVDSAVMTLLDLKKKLAQAQGIDAQELIGGGGKKKKGKKK
ncbi:methionine--tRNA ligase, cytoplasmic-like [Tubulanus polymorphus]|uniref:methionine--tRNA ligase, cytoplasmic-like n=1 Tax=Tubulanus polymorphus TaxID=672921 RepID=UPI003DA275C3